MSAANVRMMVSGFDSTAALSYVLAESFDHNWIYLQLKSPEENLANWHLTVLSEGDSEPKPSASLRAASTAESSSLN